MAGMREDKDAINFDEEYFVETIKEIEAFVTERVTGINDRSEGQAKDDIDEIRREIKEFFDFWQSDVNECNEANPSVPLYFGRRFMVNPPTGDTRRLLKTIRFHRKGQCHRNSNLNAECGHPCIGEYCNLGGQQCLNK